jgi:hypothetical protein
MLELTPEEKVSTISSPTTSLYEPNPNSQKAQESTPDDGTDKEETATGGEVEVEYASGFKLAAVVAALALSVFLVSLDMTIVATAIPKITDVSLRMHSQEPPALIIC